MKNLKIYKKAFVLVTSASILLLSGCSVTNSQNTNETNNKSEDKCKHLTIFFENKPITFKQCDGFKMDISRMTYSSEIDYKITRKNDEIISGTTSNYHEFFVDHSEADTYFDDESIKKLDSSFTLNEFFIYKLIGI